MKLALGTVQMGKRYGVQKNKKPDFKDSLNILDAAGKCGICTFDTAAVYGNSESIIGNFLKSREEKRSSFEIITKLPPDILDGTTGREYEKVIESEAKKSLNRLKTDYLDGLLFHNAAYVHNTRAMEALIKSKSNGFIKQAGISVYTPEGASEALRYSVDIIQVPYNIFDRRFDRSGFFETAKKKGITVFARSPLLQGLLAMPDGRIPHGMEFAAGHISEYRKACSELNMTPLECAIGFAAHNENIDYLLFGVDNTAQLYEIAEAAGKTMDQYKYDYLCERFITVPERLIRPDLWRT